jgi:hypothetical protein
MAEGVAVGVDVAVLVGVKVVVGVMVAKGLGTVDRLLHPDNKKAPITPHARIIPKTNIEILGFSKGSLSVGPGVSFMPFLLLVLAYGRLGI